MKKEFVNYFELLGLPIDASNNDIAERYNSLGNELNEAISNTNDEKKIEILKQKKELINEAIDTLLDPDKKAKYMDKLMNVIDNGQVVEGIEEEEIVFEGNREEVNEDVVIESDGDLGDQVEANTSLVKTGVTQPDVVDNAVIVDAIVEDEDIDDDIDVANIIDADSTENSRSKRMAVVDVEDSEEAKEASRNGNKVVKIVVASVLAAAILIGSCGLAYYFANKNKNGKKNDKDDSSKASYTLVLSDDDNVPAVTTTGQVTEKPEETTKGINEAQEAAQEVINGGIINRGDAQDPKVLEDRANTISEFFAKNGIYNPNTMSPYTIDEIKDILLFVNGAYVPSREADAYSMVDNQLNFIAANISSFRNLDMVNYLADSDVIDENMIEADINEYPTIDYVDAMLLGDSHCYPYLKWFNGKYNEMISTTDKEKSRAIFAEMSQSLADLVLGDGYRLDDVVYTIRDFSGKGNINDGNMLMMLVNMFSVYNTRYVKHDYVVNKRIVGDFSLTIDQVTSQFDLACAEDLILLQEDDVIPDDINRDEQNYHNRLQIDTINAALTNGMLQNQEYYEDQYKLAR